MASYSEQMELIEEIFNLFDTDGQKQLDEEELASAIFAMGFSQHGHVQESPMYPAQHLVIITYISCLCLRLI
jgi:hypothetical protein